jgi:molecular chaperone GrpE
MSGRRRGEGHEQERAAPDRGAPAGPPADRDESGASAEEQDPSISELTRLRAREDELLRALAEQQNVVRRRRQEMESTVLYSQEELVRELLPVLDDFERALKAMEGKEDESIRSGVAMIHDRLLQILERQGLAPIRPRGERFDPALHDALAEQSGTGATPGTIVEVVQPGYRFRDRVLRHAKVVVAGPSESAGAPPVAGERSASGAPR